MRIHTNTAMCTPSRDAPCAQAPHWHGDPFGDEVATNCLYGPSNYSDGNIASHPPVIGFSYDGILIYGCSL